MKLEEQLYDVKRVAIAGHVKPDGDCVGCLLYTSDAADD